MNGRWFGIPAVMLCVAVSPTLAAADASSKCGGEYAEDLSALSARARSIESATSVYSYAVRTSATYECVSYGPDGNLKKVRSTVRAYGTAFGYRHDDADTLLLTNEHVAEWPVVTDDEHPVDGVAAGCKKVSDSLKIVDDDRDDYAADDIVLTRVVVDPALDVAILRAHARLEIIPWRIGKSAALVARNVVQVKGFPLGEFRATNIGKVISAYDHDVQGVRNHDDFVIDALLTSGGSGSPVFAVSCKTGQFELVGIYHAHYTGASGLNVVVAIDQVRDLMTTLKRSPPAERAPDLDASARAHLVDSLRRDPDPPFFAIGTLVASVHARSDGSLVFAVFASDFPKTSRPLLVVEDLAASDPAAFGRLGAVYLGGGSGLHAYATAGAGADALALLARTLAALREGAAATFDLRAATRAGVDSRSASHRLAARKRAFDRMLAGQRDTAAALVELVGRETAKASGAAIRLGDIEADPPAATEVASKPG